MTDLTMEDVTNQLLAVLDEAFSEDQKPWVYFTDPSPDASYFGALSTIDITSASLPVANTSIAQQVNHVTFAMRASSAFIRNHLDSPDSEQWKRSWHVPSFDEETWQKMQVELRNAYNDLRKTIKNHAVTRVESVGGAIGAVAHVAYHLGAIKQKIAILS